jgi:hypothetical protein
MNLKGDGTPLLPGIGLIGGQSIILPEDMNGTVLKG